MNDGTLYLKAWKGLRRSRRIVFLMWLGWVPGAVTLIGLFTWFVHSLRRYGLPVPDGVIVAFTFTLFAAWGYVWLATWRRVREFRCPRCGQRIERSFTSLCWRARCPSCGLREP